MRIWVSTILVQVKRVMNGLDPCQKNKVFMSTMLMCEQIQGFYEIEFSLRKTVQ